MTPTLTCPSDFTDGPAGARERRWARRRDGKAALPHRHAWPAPLTAAETSRLMRLTPAMRQRPITDFALDPVHRVHIGRLQNRRLGVLTVGECADGELTQALGTWAGVGPTLAHWFRATLLRLAA